MKRQGWCEECKRWIAVTKATEKLHKHGMGWDRRTLPRWNCPGWGLTPIKTREVG